MSAMRQLHPLAGTEADRMSSESPIKPQFDSPRCTCFDRDGRYWCLLHDPDWPDTPEELIEAMNNAE